MALFFIEKLKRSIQKKEWIDAGDEKTREDHVFLGSLGPMPIDHDYAGDIGSSGSLKYPSDINGAPDQVINCRCVVIAVG